MYALRPSFVSQNFPWAPAFTEKNLPDLSGRVYIVTGANTGVGRELTRILYGANAIVYLACRSETKGRQAIEELQLAATPTHGRLEFLLLDLADLRSIKPAVDVFLARESRLDVLFNNAGVLVPPEDEPRTAQGYDLEIGVNCLAPFLFTRLLTPMLAATARSGETTPPGSVRVVWVSSIAAEMSDTGGIDVVNLPATTPSSPIFLAKYAASKAGNYLHSTEFARRHRVDGIVSIAANPGNLDSDLYRNSDNKAGLLHTLVMKAFVRFMLYPSVYGAYTELFAGLSPDVTLDKSGGWIGPWGRFLSMRSDILHNAQPKSEGGGGGGEAFWDWSEEQVKLFM
ncbi:short chain dehydrogenase reductase [Grosmannia clavigera kw1407]|uniref:Short chain dehydrogenase reductase n=1 Tax=Grosmannia clavigera (strain kw1407 / UAMH 11150) TaxID=655863 RepID=F0XSH9_GROCL|nr:short chain dehydrogenase reductase [Grosmannia clavigera kw1407]EFW99272.1 short chain dehydrogenase reductase [Grosmannia clavigera kw1407]